MSIVLIHMDSGYTDQPQIDQQIDKIVLSYLHQKGYKNAEKALAGELGSVDLDEFIKGLNEKQEENMKSMMVDNMLFYGFNQTQPEAFSRQYEALIMWIDKTSSDFKSSLEVILYPVFMHIYMILVNRGDIKEALMFLEKNKKRFVLIDGNENTSVESDLMHLESLRLPIHLEENDFARELRDTQYTLSMHEMAYAALVNYLCDQKLAILICILNTFVKVSLTYGPVPRGSANFIHQASSAAATTASTQLTGDDFVKSINAKDVLWGVSGVESSILNNRSSSPGINISGVTTSSNDKSGLNGTHQIEDGSHVPEYNRIPGFSPMIYEADSQFQEDVLARVPIKDTVLPSVCMYTFYNAKETLSSLRISNDSYYAAAGFSDSLVRVYSLTNDDLITINPNLDITKSTVESGNMYDETIKSKEKELIGHHGAVYAVDFSPDNKYVLSCSADATVRLWSMDTFTTLVVYKGHDYPVWDACFSPFGFYFATCSYDKTARLWCTAQIYPLRIFVGHLGSVDTLCFHPNGNYLFTGSSDKTVRMWDVQTGDCVRIFSNHHRTEITKILVSRDGKCLVSAGSDGSLVAWDISTAKKSSLLIGHTDAIYSLSFCYDGFYIASGSADNTVRLWDLSRMRTTVNNSELPYIEATCILPTLQVSPIELMFSRRNILLAAGASSSTSPL